jgi:hypothetical protein
MTYDDEVLADSPIGYWRLQDGSTSMSDFSGNGRNGTLFGSAGNTYALQQPSLIESEPAVGCLGLMSGGAYNAGWTGVGTTIGSTSYVTIANNAAWNLLGDFTAEIWVKTYPNYWPSGDTIFGRRKNTVQWALAINQAPTFNIWFDGSANGTYTGYVGQAIGAVSPKVSPVAGLVFDTTVNPLSIAVNDVSPALAPYIHDGNPHHIVGVRRGTAIELWVDSFLVSKRLFGDTQQSNAADPLIIGSYTDTATQGMVGYLQKAALYNTALSADRIAAHYYAAKKKISALNLRWSLDALVGSDTPAQPLVITDVAQYFYSAGMVKQEGVGLSDVTSAFLALGNAITDGFILTNAQSAAAAFGPDVTEAITTSDTDSGTKQITAALVDGLAAIDTQSAGTVMIGTITDGAVIYCGLQHGEEAYAGYVLNADTNASSFYEGFDFNSLAKIGPDYYGANPSGVFKLEGSTDAGEQIDAMVNVGTSDAMTAKKKGYDSVYLGLTAGGKMVLKVIVDGTEYLYEATDSAATMKEVRVVPGKGLQATFWQFELWNQDGADFDVASVEFHPVILTRRI